MLLTCAAALMPPMCARRAWEQLETLQFFSWWQEGTGRGMVRRSVEVRYLLRTREFQARGSRCMCSLARPTRWRAWCTQVLIEGDDKMYTISHILGREGRPLEALDLHIGARIDVLGRPTTLMQVRAARG